MVKKNGKYMLSVYDVIASKPWRRCMTNPLLFHLRVLFEKPNTVGWPPDLTTVPAVRLCEFSEDDVLKLRNPIAKKRLDFLKEAMADFGLAFKPGLAKPVQRRQLRLPFTKRDLLTI